jgi:hypothetical protein
MIDGERIPLTAEEELIEDQRNEAYLAEISSLEYRQKQAAEKRIYKSWQEQLDMQYHDKINNTNTWVEYISSVKAANPKPEK